MEKRCPRGARTTWRSRYRARAKRRTVVWIRASLVRLARITFSRQATRPARHASKSCAERISISRSSKSGFSPKPRLCERRSPIAIRRDEIDSIVAHLLNGTRVAGSQDHTRYLRAREFALAHCTVFLPAAPRIIDSRRRRRHRLRSTRSGRPELGAACQRMTTIVSMIQFRNNVSRSSRHRPGRQPEDR